MGKKREVFDIDFCSSFSPDASIRTHERTEYAPDDNEDIISATLRERLDELPQPEQPEREINIINLRKDDRHGLGFTIVGGENSHSMDLGIFVQSITPNGPAEQDGRLQSGDRIISINGQSLEGVSHRIAVDILRGSEGAVQFIVSQPKSSSPGELIDEYRLALFYHMHFVCKNYLI